MADKDTRFNMTISYDISKVSADGPNTPFTSASLVYNGVDLLQITATQDAIAKFAQSLVNMGFEAAAEAGFDVSKLKGKQ